MLIYGLDCETTGLSPFENEVITVQYAEEDGSLTLYRRWQYDTEADLLVDFLRDWRDIKRKRDAGGALFVGYNLLKFDVPFLFAKCLTDPTILEDLAWTPQDCWKQLYRWPMYLDLAHLLGSDFVSMRSVREALLGTTDPIPSRDIPVYYADGDYDTIERYVTDEMATLRELFLELQRTPMFEELMAFRRRLGYDRELA